MACERIRPGTVSSSRIASLTALVLFLAPGRAQEVAEKPQPIRVEILTVDAGKRVPRLPDAGETESGEVVPFKLVDRRVAWLVDGKRAETRDEFRRELANAVERWQTRQGGTADEPPRPDVLLSPDERAVWVDVVEAIDDTYGAGCSDVQLAESGAFPIALGHKSVVYPVREGGAIVVPAAVYQVPDEDDSEPRGYWRPTIVVRQDGRTQYRGRTLFDSTQPDANVEALRETLRVIGRRALSEHGFREGGPDDRKQLKGRLLIHADKWARWFDVRRVLQEGTRVEPAFWWFDLALADVDYEELLAKGKRF